MTLVDLLLKREYMIRKLSKNFNINLPKNLITNPTNELLMDLKSDIILNNEVFVENEFNNIRSIDLFKVLNNKYYSNFFKSFFKKINKNLDISENSNLYEKSQYKHMRKGISNMVKIQADNAVALPTNTRIQLITVSKDIIHS
jgi:hypothetical protein